MLQNWLILLPELSLLSFLPVAWLVERFRDSKTAKTFFTLSKFFLLTALLFTVVFYNKSVWNGWWLNNRYSTLFKVAVYLVALVWFYLSSKWFLNKNRSSFRFYAIGMSMLLLFGLLLSAQNFVLPVVLVWYIFTELGSIAENAAHMGADVPDGLLKLLAAGKKAAERQTKDDEE